MSPLPCQRCGRTPADETRPVRRFGKHDLVYFCPDCWQAVFSRDITAKDLAREARARKMIEDAMGDGGQGRT